MSDDITKDKEKIEAGWLCCTCGNNQSIEEIKSMGLGSCCPERRLIDPANNTKGPE